MKKTILIAIVAVLALASCKKEELPTPTNQSQAVGSNCSSVQYSAIAVSTSSRCKRTTTNCNGRCFQHQ
jgi:nitrous oxide reductase accessory protein NosL